MGRIIIAFFISSISATVFAQDFGRAEYFFDNDPGVGNGTTINLGSTASPLVFTTSIATTSLSPGFHHLGIRVKEAGGPWGEFEARGFYISVATSNAEDITSAEYFFDADPGIGNGISIPVTAGATTNFTVSIPTSLAPGFHFLAIRTKGSDLRWGLFEARGFYVSAGSADAADIVDAEYFFDTDPGTGLGTSLTVPSGANSTFTVSLPATSLSPGFHFLSIRIKGSDGKWGAFETRGFYISTQTSDATDIVAAEYFFDTDPGEGNALPLTINTPGATINQAFLINIPEAFPAGAHAVSIRVQTSNGRWSFIETGSFTVTTNALPVANAGSDLIVTLPVNSASLDGTASNDPDGTITSHSWVKISGPAQGTINNGNQSTASAENLTAGVYAVELMVTDNNGTVDRDTVLITVNGTINQLPVANAGPDQTVTLPANSATLDGSISADPDGTITVFAWTQLNGPSSIILTNQNQSVATANNFTQGTYEFQLTVTDNNGDTDKDTVRIVVNPTLNIPPVANAGTDQVITLPTNIVSLDGSTSTDSDGTLVNFSWVKISGPASANLSNANQSNATLNNLVNGLYQIELTVTDNSGATDKDTVQITVNPALNQLPEANAGIDQTITLPLNTTILNGSASTDIDGTINSITWVQISGPSSATIINANLIITVISNLNAGTYLFELSITDNTGATAKDIVMVTVNPATNCPQVPVITQIGNQLLCNPGGVSYQWYNNGIPIEGATGQILEITVIEYGLYAVEITSGNCTVRSEDFIFLITETEGGPAEIKIYPNPVTDKLIIDIAPGHKTSTIKFVDVLGRTVIKSTVSSGRNKIETGHLPGGIYYVYIDGKFGYKVQKL